jgi:uncharacterized SAM-binding protein YcdF (DUF218 family)
MSMQVDDTPVAPIRPLDQPGRRRRRRSPADGRARRNMRRAARAGLILLVAIAGYLAVTLYQVWSTGRSQYAGTVDAIVVMGAAQYDGRPSPQLAARLDHAAALWPTGQADLVVVTGGNRPGDRFTEAQASANYLIAAGVPDADIRREVQGESSWESLAASARFLRAEGINEVLLVSDPYHALRIGAIAAELGLDAHVSPTRSSPVSGAANLRAMVREAAAVSLGRIVGYRRLMRLEA